MVCVKCVKLYIGVLTICTAAKSQNITISSDMELTDFHARNKGKEMKKAATE